LEEKGELFCFCKELNGFNEILQILLILYNSIDVFLNKLIILELGDDFVNELNGKFLDVKGNFLLATLES
jgi:hypothetical protein